MSGVFDVVIDCSVLAAMAGWREPIDMEVANDMFLQFLLESEAARAAAGSAHRPAVFVPVMDRRQRPPSMTIGNQSNAYVCREVLLDEDLIENGLRIQTPIGASTVRMKPGGRREMRELLARYGR